MIATQKCLDLITNNLANASTIGFKRDGISFANTIEQQLQSGLNPIGTLSTGVTDKGQFTQFEPGALMSTTNPLDVAISGEKGAFAFQSPTGILYTRNGSFELDANRQLVTKQGYPILDENYKPITVENGMIQIGADGTISANGKTAGKIGTFEGTFVKMGGNSFTSTTKATSIEPNLRVGALEASNVNAIESMVEMITLNRNFELAQKSMSQQDDLTQRLIQSLQGQ